MRGYVTFRQTGGGGSVETQYGILGPLSVRHDEQPVPVPGPRIRATLAMLLVQRNRLLSVDQFIDGLWGERPPRTARSQVHTVVSRLRQALPAEARPGLALEQGGYRFTVADASLDSVRFTDGVSAVRSRPGAASVAQLRQALALWRGEALSGIDAPFVPGARARLQEERMLAWEFLADQELEQANHASIVPELSSLLNEYPYWEAIAERLALALFRSGRQTDAFTVLRTTRTRLVDEYGLDPGPGLAALEHAMLRNEVPAPRNAPVEAAATGGGGGLAEPHPARYQLPADTRSFTGRTEELGQLLALVRSTPSDGAPETVVISAIDGMAGIGKSALAVHLAHRVRDRFPDGQLFIDLHGHTPGLAPLTVAEALGWFLRTLGVPPHLVPQDPGECAALYRDRLSGSRTLIVLDNASSTAQVRPLLPAAPGCLVLVTSRKRLTGLDDAHTVALGTLEEAEAVALLHRVAGDGRIPGDHPAIPELNALCGHMPLAIRIVAARLRHRPALRLDDVVAQLRDHSRLDYLQDEDRDLTAVFESSYRSLPAAEQRLFRCLGLVPGVDFDAHVAANLLDADRHTAERLLESLLDHNLLTQQTSGRYRFHDLVRLYARTLAPAGEPEQQAVLERLLDYYQHTAETADRHLARRTRPGPPSVAAHSVTAPALGDRSTALAWMRGERDNLLAAHAVTRTRPERFVAFTGALAGFLLLDGPWQQAAAAHEDAAAVARGLADPIGEANALCDLARVRLATGGYPSTADWLDRALELYRGAGDGSGEANALCDLGRMRHLAGDFPAAAELLGRALELARNVGDRFGEANARCELGRGVHALTGDFPRAVLELRRCLTLYQELGDRFGEASSLSELGRIGYLTGDMADAAVLMEQAGSAFRDLGSLHGEASSLGVLGRIRLVTGDYPGADDRFERARVVFQELGHRQGEANALWGLGRVARASGDLAGAKALFERVLTIFQELGGHHGEAIARHELGCVAHAAGEHESAAALLKQALAAFQDFGATQSEAQVLVSTAALVSESTGPDEALTLYRQALELARKVDSALDEAQALHGAARCAADLGDRGTALADLRQAVALYRRIGAAETADAAALLSVLESSASESSTSASAPERP